MRYRKSKNKKKSRKKTLRNNYGKSTRKTRQRRTHKTQNSGKRRRTNRRRTSKIKKSGGGEEGEAEEEEARQERRKTMTREELINELDTQDVDRETQDGNIAHAANVGQQLVEQLKLKEEALADAEERAEFADELGERLSDLEKLNAALQDDVTRVEAAVKAAEEEVADAEAIAATDRLAIVGVEENLNRVTEAAAASEKAANIQREADANRVRTEKEGADQLLAEAKQEIVTSQGYLEEKRAELKEKKAEIVKLNKKIEEQQSNLQALADGNTTEPSAAKLREELNKVQAQLAMEKQSNVELTAAVEAVEAQGSEGHGEPSLFDELDLGTTEKAGLVGIDGPYAHTFDVTFTAGTDLGNLDNQRTTGKITIDISLGPNTGIQITPTNKEPDTLLNFYYLKSLNNTGGGLDIEYEIPGESKSKRAYSIEFKLDDLGRAITLLRSAYSISHSMINNLQPSPGLGIWKPDTPEA